MAAEASSADPQRLSQARAALERGDYGLVVRLLLGRDDGTAELPRDPEQLLLLATAWMGQGRSQEALACCRRLRACGDATLKAQARELQRVLEAPALQRPREWSLTLPDLAGQEVALGRQLGSLRRRRPKPPPPPPPAVGPTKAPLGFAVVVIALVVLGLLLGGCAPVRSELHFAGAGRLQLRHHLLQDTPSPPAWQQQLGQRLRPLGLKPERIGRELVLSSPVLPSRQALDLLGTSLTLAAEQAGLSLPAPQLQLQSHNWLVGVDERYDLRVDLRPLDALKLDLALVLDPVAPAALQSAAPLQPQVQDRALLWPLQFGSDNRLRLHLWRWSPLGLGGVGVAVLLLLSLCLQQLRQKLGYGLPGLPR